MFARTQNSPVLPPPNNTTGAIAWIKQNLFYSLTSSCATILIALFVGYTFVHILSWAIADAVFIGDSRTCQENSAGACWTFVTHNFDLFVYGLFDQTQRWRINIALAILILGIAYLLFPRAPARKWAVLFMLLVYPFLATWLLRGGLGLAPVSPHYWGGFTLTLVVAITGIVFSLPFGILLALARRSNLPIIKVVAVTLIEFCRGVPLITVLFMSAYLLPFFLSPKPSPDADAQKLLQVLFGVVLFSSAYMAEVIRGGLQALPQGQVEAAQAVGLSYWRIQLLIVLPQALKIVIPGIVNSYISLFKDTTLVSIIALFDFLNIVHSATRNSEWLAPTIPVTSYVFMAAVFWLFCYGMSRYSRHLEQKLNTNHR